mmetsp:Transcript_42491/g.133838  ORF Transcript_42491/g.133838 Transcript_42491/m.133838 type:complete len:208 (+) Transcript_42491:928-1551(+)
MHVKQQFISFKLHRPLPPRLLLVLQPLLLFVKTFGSLLLPDPLLLRSSLELQHLSSRELLTPLLVHEDSGQADMRACERLPQILIISATVKRNLLFVSSLIHALAEPRLPGINPFMARAILSWVRIAMGVAVLGSPPGNAEVLGVRLNLYNGLVRVWRLASNFLDVHDGHLMVPCLPLDPLVHNFLLILWEKLLYHWSQGFRYRSKA